MEDRTETGRRRVSVGQAAEELGITVEAVRGRIKRGTLQAEREGEHVFVLLGADRPRPDTDQSTDQAQPDALIEAKDETIALLRMQLEAERQAHAEARRLLMAALERIPPQLEPPREEARESPETATEQPGRVGPQTEVEAAQEPAEPPVTVADEQQGRGPVPDAGGPPEGTHRPWWRRLLSG